MTVFAFLGSTFGKMPHEVTSKVALRQATLDLGYGALHESVGAEKFHGLHRSGGRPADEFATFETRDQPGKRWLNVRDPLEFGEEWGRWFAARFPNPSRWEIPG